MSEFGHDGIIVRQKGGGYCLDSWGAGPFVIVAEGKSFRFEDSDRFGPSLIKLNGDIATKPAPPERSPFWRAHRIWVRQGRRVLDDKITCVWDEPKPMKIVRLNRRNAYLVENGEEDGKTIVIDPTSPEGKAALAEIAFKVGGAPQGGEVT